MILRVNDNISQGYTETNSDQGKGAHIEFGVGEGGGGYRPAGHQTLSLSCL